MFEGATHCMCCALPRPAEDAKSSPPCFQLWFFLQSYYYGGSSGRKLASIDRHLSSYGYYGGHRRSLMSVGQEGSFGRILTVSMWHW